MSKHLGVVITDGVGYRNFLMSNFVKQAAQAFEKITIYSGLPKTCYNFDLLPANITVIDLPMYVENKKIWGIRKLKEVTHLYLHRDYYGIKDNLRRNYPNSFSKRNVLLAFIHIIAGIFKSEKFINKVENVQFKAYRKDNVYHEYVKILNETAPDLLFFTHQRPPYLTPILAAAKSLEIKSSSFIFSWDNLASKGRMLGTFDAYLVWSDLMKQELLHFYPNTSEEKVAIVGTPQFEPYVMEEYFMSKPEFINKFELHPDKRVICYSCADASIGGNDPIHIRSIMEFIKKNSDLNLQLLVRTSPAEDGKRFDPIKKEFPEIKWNVPKWIQARAEHAESWSQRLPSVEDVIDLKSVLMYSDLNVNMLSTMSLDFMLFDKPVVNTVFGNKENGLYDDQCFLRYKHYEYVIESKAVTIAKNNEELHEQLKNALLHPEERAVYRKELLALEIGGSIEGTSNRLVEALLQI